MHVTPLSTIPRTKEEKKTNKYLDRYWWNIQQKPSLSPKFLGSANIDDDDDDVCVCVCVYAHKKINEIYMRVCVSRERERERYS